MAERSRSFSNGRSDRERRRARRAASGGRREAVSMVLAAVRDGRIAPEVVAFISRLPDDESAARRACAEATALVGMGGHLAWRPSDDIETEKKGYGLDFHADIPKEGSPGSTFARIQVDLDIREDELTPQAEALLAMYREARPEMPRLEDTISPWWYVRTQATAGDPLSLKVLARLRDESPPEYEAVLQGWSRILEAGSRLPRRERWREVELHVRDSLLEIVRRATGIR